MVFSGLAEKLQSTLDRLRGKGKLNEQDVKEAMREVRIALLEADVNFKIVKDFVQRVKERAVGKEVMESLTPGQQVVKIVQDELTQLMGGQQAKIELASNPPTVILMVGLQGSGKTTTSAKLANHLKSQGRQPLLVAADLQRPAAVDQLQTLGKEIEVPVFERGTSGSPVELAGAARREAKRLGCDVIIVDTAGRLQVDQELMEELEQVAQEVDPNETLLVVDAMTGQDAVNVASEFDKRLGLTGLVLTKLDGDTRGGAALSVRQVTGCPVKFAGTGERVDALEPFHPDRMASRILGMGDVLSLIEKAQDAVDEKKARELEEKMRNATFTFDDFLDQLEQVRKMGPLDEILGMLPGMGKMKQLKDLSVDEKELAHVEAIINSMTARERVKPDIINGSRRRRIARGSGTSVRQVNALLKQFNQTRKLMKQFANGNKKLKGLGAGRLPF